MVIMVQFNPELAKSTPADGPVGHASTRPESLYSNRGSISSRNSVALLGVDASDHGDDEFTGQSFTYIPPNPKKFYKKLIERCIEYDLRAMHTLPEDQEVPLGILSTSHLDVINECALRWRVMQSYRVSAFLEVIKYKYEREEVPLECIPEALQHVEKEFEPERWPNTDVGGYPHSLSPFLNVIISGSTWVRSTAPCLTSSWPHCITTSSRYLTFVVRPSPHSLVYWNASRPAVCWSCIMWISRLGCASYQIAFEYLPCTIIPTKVLVFSPTPVSTGHCLSSF